MKKIIIVLLILSSLSLTSQESKILTPTGEETQTLAKLKERILKLRAEGSTIEIQLYALQKDKILKQQELQKAISDLNMEAINVKEAHKKDWGAIDNINYAPEDQSSEAGAFTLIKKEEVKKDETSKESIKKDAGNKKEKERKIK